MKSFFRELILTLILALAIFFLLQTTVQTYVVFGSSMEPNLHTGDRLIINKIVYHLHDPERGDVIILHPPNRPRDKSPFIKRIIALPGDTVEIKDGAVYVNDRRLTEPYIMEPLDYVLRPYNVPENEYFVLGDNRNISDDSHSGWTVSRQDIVGKAWLAIWPLDKWGVVADYSLSEQLASLMSN